MHTITLTETPKLAPQSVQDTGIRRNLLEDIALKTIYLEGELNLRELGERMGLSYALVDDLFQHLRKAQLCEVKGMDHSVHRVTTSSQGKARAQDLLSVSQYVGIVPVSLEDYSDRVREQSVSQAEVHQDDVRRAFAPLVLTEDTIKQLGIAVVSGTSIVLHGPTGTGKTAIAECIPSMYQDSVWIPYAVEVDGQIITVYDPGVHRRVEQPMAHDSDRRWVLCERPRIVSGGELTIEMLDLQFNPVSKYYAAPLQMKANNGVFIVDDFGRQRVRPEELLNRWVVPLDRRVDYLTLMGGKKLEIPFELFVVFSTNLEPSAVFTTGLAKGALTDEAFLRRIPNKIRVGYVAREHFRDIFRGVCGRFGLAFNEEIVERFIDYLRTELNEPLRPCYPRDIVQQICWEARFEGKEPELQWPAVTRACRSYFLRSEPA